MNHDALFSHLSFPVFAADSSGLVFYKNPAAIRHIGTMRKGSRVTRHFLTNALPSSAGIVPLSSPSYPNAFAALDEKEYLFLAFSRLQYPDCDLMLPHTTKALGTTPDSVRNAFERFCRQGEDKPFPTRIYPEVFRLAPKRALNTEKAYHLGAFVSPLFEKAEQAFPALGYRMQTHISEEFKHTHPVGSDRFDLLFLFGSMLYLGMKLSADRTIKLDLTDTEGAHLLQLKTRTTLSFSQRKFSAFDLFYEYAPACAAEFVFMGMTPLAQALIAETNTRGELLLSYRIPYLAPVLPVHSTSYAEEHTALFDRLLAQIADMLKETSSSC